MSEADARKLEELRREIAKSIAEGERGDVIEVACTHALARDIIAEGRRILAQRKASQAETHTVATRKPEVGEDGV